MSPENHTEQLNAVEAAVKQAGGVRNCARLLRVSERSIFNYMRRGHLRGVAVERVLLLELKSGITAENLVGRLRARGTLCAQ
jgi:hypothetical protein